MKFTYILRFSFLLTLLLPNVVVAELQAEALHSKLVTTSIKYDTFNQRCRGVSAAKNESKVNRLFLRKYGVTVNNYIKTYLSTDARDIKNDVKDQMIKTIAQMGGCQQARQKGLEKELKADYRKLYRATEQSTWFPEVKNL